MDHVSIPELDELFLAGTLERVYDSKVPFADMASETFMVLHTSGTTGLPKPVPITHGQIASTDAQHDLPRTHGRALSCDHWAYRPVYMALPPFHIAGMDFFFYSVFFETQLVFGPSDKPPSILTVDTILTKRITEVGVVAPSILADIASDDKVLVKLANWSSVVFGGAPLREDIGNKIRDYTLPLQVFGSPETNQNPELHSDEWAYHSYHPDLGIEFRCFHEDLYELVLFRNAALKRHQGVFFNLPLLEEYSMKDLYKRRPSKDGLWKYVCRADDIIVLSNGEKFNPVDAEQMISKNALVKAAMIVGNGKMQPALLLELNSPQEEVLQPQQLAKLDPISDFEELRRANQMLPAHGQIHSSHIHLLKPPATLENSPKGGLLRSLNVKNLAGTIARAYHEADAAPSLHHLQFTDERELCRTLLELIASENLVRGEVTSDSSIFNHGFDSLVVLRLFLVSKLS